MSEINDLVAAGVGWHRTDDEWAAESDKAMIDAVLASARTKRRERKPSLARALKEAERAGLTVKRATVDGVTLEFGQPDPAPALCAPPKPTNPWDIVYGAPQ
jgi:hypothetical protein